MGRHAGEFTFDQPPRKVYEAAVRAIEGFGWKTDENNPESMEVRAKVPADVETLYSRASRGTFRGQSLPES